SEAFFDPRFPHPKASSAEAKLAEGRALRSNPEALRAALATLVEPGAPPAAAGANEAVVGAAVAAALDVRVGDRIEPTHGVENGGTAHRERQLWEVVGVLAPSGTPIDELVLINLDSFYRIGDHAGGVVPETNQPGISAVLLFPKPG